jgi:hypothetical protein
MENESQNDKSIGDRGGAAVEETNNARTSHKDLDIRVVSYKYKRMRQKEEMNLVVVKFEVEVGTVVV